MERYLLASITMTFGGFGIVLNLIAIWLLFKTPHLKNSFGYLNVNRILADVANLMVFTAWIGPLTILSSDSLGSSFFGQIMVISTSFFFSAAMITNLALATNRFIAVQYPQHYKISFNKCQMCITILCIWILAAGFNIGIPLGNCYGYYVPSKYLMMLNIDECKQFGVLLNYYSGMLVVGISLAINIYTLILLIRLSKRTSTSRLVADKRNRRFFYQILAEEVKICILFAIHPYLVQRISVDSQFFIFANLSWEFQHITPGLFMFIFNVELRKKLFDIVLCREKKVVQQKTVWTL